MAILRVFGKLIGVGVAALVGNYVGDQMRARATGEEGHHFQFSHGEEGEETVVAINPNLTNFLPGVLAGLMLKPRLVWAFLGGVLAAGFLGNQYEQKAKDWVKSKMPTPSDESE